MLFQFFSAVLALITVPLLAADRADLRVGVAGHAFDHLGAIDAQARAAVMSGATILYGTGFGAHGYQGLPPTQAIEETHRETKAYLAEAKKNGLQLALGYVCATSIVKLDTFDRNWPKEFRDQFASPPSQWLQQDSNGKALPSWYGGDYQPACMNHPDWRAYEQFIVRRQIESGFDGIFFDNPTVHPQGCYCRFCMAEFALFLANEGRNIPGVAQNTLEDLRQLAVKQPKDFMRFRCTIAANFMSELRSYARTLKPDALVTCNNSLNSPEAFFSQCRTHAYNIFEMSKVEDLVVVEDMANQPRVLADGKVTEYGPVYQMLRAISRGKPLVAVTIAEGDYHTPPNLVRLAMAEAAAHNASYLSWPTWPEDQRTRMIAGIRPQANLLRENANFLNETDVAPDALLFLPFRRYVETADCQPLKIARALSSANVQFEVVSEDALDGKLKSKAQPVLLVESPDVLLAPETAWIEIFKRRGGKVVFTETENWLAGLQGIIEKPSVKIEGPTTVRVIVRDQPRKRIIHLYNLNVQRLSSFEDKVNPVADLHLQVRLPFASMKSVKALSADPEASQGLVPYKLVRDKKGSFLEITIPRLLVSTILVIE